MTTPRTMYEVHYVWRSHDCQPDDVLERHEIRPVHVTWEGIRPGCSAPTILATDSKGNTFRGSARDFFETEIAARLHIRRELAQGVADAEKDITNVQARLSNLKRLLDAQPTD